MKAVSSSSDKSVEKLKIPPHSIEAEQAVLGSMLIDPETWDKVTELVTDTEFYNRSHQIIFKAILDLLANSNPVDLITVSEVLEKNDQLEDAGGFAYLGELARNTPSSANVTAYAKIIRERAITRELIGVANEIAEVGYNPEGRDSADILDMAESKVFEIAERRTGESEGPQSIESVLGKTIDRLETLIKTDKEVTGVTTGFQDLDKKTSGLQGSDLFIVAARPSMGKTTYAMNLVENALLATKRPCLVFSLEMPSESIVMRMLSSIGKIDQTRIRSGKLIDEDWPKLSAAVNMLKDLPLYIDDTAALTPQEMRARARKVYRENNNDLAMIMVDYLQLMRVSGPSEGRTQEISEISRTLKIIAKEFNCPMIALSQLNRSLEQRPNKRPVNSDLRESGAIEQDADIIQFIYRDEVYNEDSPDKGIAEIITGKHRNGPIGIDRLAFIGKYTRFENLAHGYDGDDEY